MFSVNDMFSSFWQVKIKSSDRQKTAFSIEGGGFWQFRVMPFGTCNSSATFERLVEKALNGLTWKICLIYINIIIFSKTFEEHLDRLDQVFSRIADAKLKLSPKKCSLLQKQVNFLGHTVSEDGIATDEEKIKAVKDWPVPRNVKQARSFIGLCSYYRRFVPKFAVIARHLHKLTERGQKFVWDDSCQSAFDMLKEALITSPILSYPQEEGMFVIDADASNDGMGAVLSQVQGGEEKVISYYSKTFSKPERRYCVTRRELS